MKTLASNVAYRRENGRNNLEIAMDIGVENESANLV
jgi:hypothetical protein